MKFNEKFINVDYINSIKKQPNFDNMEKILNNQIPTNPVLFEFFLNNDLFDLFSDKKYLNDTSAYRDCKVVMSAYYNLGYDYVTMHSSDFYFAVNNSQHIKTKSLNDGMIITDRESFQRYKWSDAKKSNYSFLEEVGKILPDNMKIIAYGPGGVLENVISLLGYDNLCYLLMDDRTVVKDVFDNVGQCLVDYYECTGAYSEYIGAMISNDDWGFNTQVMLNISDMKEFVIPWHKKIVEVIHKFGKSAILHSCGNLKYVYNDIIDVIKYDAKHSFEDVIQPIENAYAEYGDRIALLGGVDIDFLCRGTNEEIFERSLNLIEMGQKKGGYALGSGNSIPYYVPTKGYLSMIAAKLFWEEK